jgi:hypothetical protein
MGPESTDDVRRGKPPWKTAVLVCLALLALPVVALILAPRAGGFVTPPPQRVLHRTGPFVPDPDDDEEDAGAPAPPPAAESASAAPEGSVFGVVTGPDHKPVASATVQCADRDKDLKTATDDAGRFHLPAKAAGCLAVAIHGELTPSDKVRLYAGRDNEFRLRAGGAIEGVVVDQHGVPVYSYLLGVESFVGRSELGDVPSPSRGAQTFSAKNGRFKLEKLVPGRYVLTASAEGRPPARSEGIQVDTDRTTRNVKIVLPKGAKLSGRVIDADTRKPLPGATVALDTVTHAGANAIQPATTDAKGAYVLDGVPSGGPFSIRVDFGGYRSRIVPGLTTTGGPITQDVELTVRADGGSELELVGVGAVLLPKGAGVMISSVDLEGPAGSAGLKAGDVLARIDGVNVTQFTVDDCVQRLRGAAGSTVVVAVDRGGEQVEVTITRALVMH